MPFDLDPEGTLTLTLPTDAHLPEPERPTFVFRFLARRQYRRYRERREQSRRAMGDEEVIAHAAAALSIGLADWFNVTGPDGARARFDPAHLADVLTAQEILWLLAKYPTAFDLDDQEERSMIILMYRYYGKFCKRCGTEGKCVNPPSPMMPIQMGLVCRLCKGDLEKRKACKACGGWGRDVIISCPCEHIQPFAWELRDVAELAGKGFWPASPAMLENTESCIRAVRWTWWLEQQVKAQMAEEG